MCFNTLHKKMKFPTEDFFSKCDQIRRKLRVCSCLIKNSLMENFIFLCSDNLLFTNYYKRAIQYLFRKDCHWTKIAAFHYGYPADLVTFAEAALNEKLHFFMQRVTYKILVCAVSYSIAIFIAVMKCLVFLNNLLRRAPVDTSRYEIQI